MTPEFFRLVLRVLEKKVLRELCMDGMDRRPRCFFEWVVCGGVNMVVGGTFSTGMGYDLQ